MSEPVRPVSEPDGLSLLALATVAPSLPLAGAQGGARRDGRDPGVLPVRPATVHRPHDFRLQIRNNPVSNITGLAAQLGF